MSVSSVKQIILSLGLPCVVVASTIQPARSQIETSGRLGTSINGGSGTQSCVSGVCAISGGTDAGSNKFHRFTLFDANRTAESSITGVTIETDAQSNVILGVASSSNGFNLSVPLSLDSSGNLFIVSPDGISLSTGASFSNVTDLTLTNLSTLPIGAGQFSVNSSLNEVQLLTGAPVLNRSSTSLSSSASPITISGVTLSVDGALYVHANSNLSVSNSTISAPTSLDVGADLTVSNSTINNNPTVSLYSEGNLSIYDSTIDGNSSVDIDAGNILRISDPSNSSDTGVSISENDAVTIDSVDNLNAYNANFDSNTALTISVGGTLNVDSISGISSSGVSINQNTSLTITTIDDFNYIRSSLNDNQMITIDAGKDFVFDSSELLRNLPYTSAQYESDFDTVSALSYFTIDAAGMIDIDDSSIDFNGPFTMVSSTSDVLITNSDFLDNLYPYLESLTGDITIASSLLSRNAFIDAYAMGSAYVFDTSVVGNDLVIGAEQGNAVIASSGLSGNVIVTTSVDGDSVIIDSDLDNNVLDVDSESGDAGIVDSDLVDTDVVVVSNDGDSVIVDSTAVNSTVDVASDTGDAAIADSELFDSDVFAVSVEGDVVVFGSNVDKSVFEAAALTGNIDVLNSEFFNNQEVAFVSDFDVSIADSSLAGNEFVVVDVGSDAFFDSTTIRGTDTFVVDAGGDALIDSSTISGTDTFVVDAGSDALIESSTISGTDTFVVDAGNEVLIEASSMSDNDDVSMDARNGLSIASNSTTESDSSSVVDPVSNNGQNSSEQAQTSGSSETQGTSQETTSVANDASADSDGESSGDSSASSESTSESSSESVSDSDSESDSESRTSSEEGGNDGASSTASNDDTADSQSGPTASSESGDAATPSFQISTLDAGVVTSNLRDSIDTNTAEVLSVLGLDDLTPTPASELTPAGISQSLNDARQVYQSLSLSSLNHSVATVASDLSSDVSLIDLKLSDLSFNPAFLNISFTKNSDLGVGDSSEGFIDLTLITSDGTVIGRRTELSLSEFADLLRGFYGKITSQRSLDPALPSSEASKLYSLFLEPIQDVLATEEVTTVLISADRGLQAIPFSALARQGQFAVDSLSFSFTPSLSLTDLSIPLASPQTDQILIMGSTQFSGLAPLPYVNQEVENIAQYYGGQSVIGDQFTSSRVVSDLRTSNESLIHLATHADFKGGRPDESMIYTSDGSISFESFKSIRRNRELNPMNLFVLSACRSALGDSDSEMGLAGLALQAGSKSAIGSLWYVDDVATSAFFSQFYRYLSDGVAKSTALAQTQRDFSSGKIKIQGSDVVLGSGEVLLSGLSAAQKYNYPQDFRHPFFWSGFVLLGTPW